MIIYEDKQVKNSVKKEYSSILVIPKYYMPR